jgi:hypothetical protein
MFLCFFIYILNITSNSGEAKLTLSSLKNLHLSYENLDSTANQIPGSTDKQQLT